MDGTLLTAYNFNAGNVHGEPNAGKCPFSLVIWSAYCARMCIVKSYTIALPDTVLYAAKAFRNKSARPAFERPWKSPGLVDLHLYEGRQRVCWRKWQGPRWLHLRIMLRGGWPDCGCPDHDGFIVMFGTDHLHPRGNPTPRARTKVRPGSGHPPVLNSAGCPIHARTLGEYGDSKPIPRDGGWPTSRTVAYLRVGTGFSQAIECWVGGPHLAAAGGSGGGAGAVDVRGILGRCLWPSSWG